MITDKLNFSTADKIIMRYANLLMDHSTANPYHKYGYSSMKGYHIKDIMNSLSLMTAYRVYQTNYISDEILVEFKKFTGHDDSSILKYFHHFIPDEEKVKLDELNKTSEDFSKNLRTVISDFQDSDEWKTVKEAESVSSFLNYCVAVKNNSNYWHLVFERLNLDCDPSDTYDKIYYEFNNEIKRENSVELNNKKVSQSSIEKEQKVNSVSASDQFELKTNRYLFERICATLVPILIFGILYWSLTNLTVRLISFSFMILLCSFMLFRLLRKKSLKTKMEKYNLISNLITIVFLTLGIFNREIGKYAVFYVIIAQLVGLSRYMLDKFSGKKVTAKRAISR